MKLVKFPVELVLRILFYLCEAYVKWYDKYSAFVPKNEDSTNSRELY